MQGIIDSTTSNSDVFKSFSAFWKKDAKDSVNSLFSYYGPIASVVVFAFFLSLGGLLSSCLSCSPIKIFLITVYVYILTFILLYKKLRSYCPSEKPVEQLAALSFWPTLLFFLIALMPFLASFLIPGIGIILMLPIIGDVVSVMLACSVYAITLPYSQYLIIQKSCYKKDIKNLWTLQT